MEKINLDEVKIQSEEAVEKETEILKPVDLDQQRAENATMAMPDEAVEVIKDSKDEVKEFVENIKDIVYEGKAADVIGYSKSCIPKAIRHLPSSVLTEILKIYDEINNKEVEDIRTYLNKDLMKHFTKAARYESVYPVDETIFQFFIEHNIRSFGTDVVIEKSEQMLQEAITRESSKLVDSGLFEEYARDSRRKSISEMTNSIKIFSTPNEEDSEEKKKEKEEFVKKIKSTLEYVNDIGKFDIIRSYVENNKYLLNRKKLFKKFKDRVESIDSNMKQNGLSRFTFGYVVKASRSLMIDPIAVMVLAAVFEKFNLAELKNRTYLFYFIVQLAAVGFCEENSNYKLKETEEFRDSFKQLCKDLISRVEKHEKDVLAQQVKTK